MKITPLALFMLVLATSSVERLQGGAQGTNGGTQGSPSASVPEKSDKRESKTAKSRTDDKASAGKAAKSRTDDKASASKAATKSKSDKPEKP